MLQYVAVTFQVQRRPDLHCPWQYDVRADAGLPAPGASAPTQLAAARLLAALSSLEAAAPPHTRLPAPRWRQPDASTAHHTGDAARASRTDSETPPATTSSNATPAMWRQPDARQRHHVDHAGAVNNNAPAAATRSRPGQGAVRTAQPYVIGPGDAAQHRGLGPPELAVTPAGSLAATQAATPRRNRW